MTESPTPSKFTKWTRPIIGGFWSSGIATVFILPALLANMSPSVNYFVYRTLQLDMLIFGFLAPGSLLTLLVDDMSGETTIVSAAILIFVWFLIGFIIAYFVKKNLTAIGLWILTYLFFLFGTLLMWQMTGG